MGPRRDVTRVRTAYAGFFVFGAFWGAWGASVPAIRDQAAVNAGQLGTALLFVGAGALPAMLVAGRFVDRWGPPVMAIVLTLLAVAGLTAAAGARDLVSLSVCLAAVGASSGAVDVAINAAAGSAERSSGRPIVTRAHGIFSAAVVLASLATGLLHHAGSPLIVPFALVAVTAVTVAAAVGTDNSNLHPRQAVGRRRARWWTRPPVPILPLVIIGILGALAFAVENAHQSWSAVYLSDVLHADPALAAAGPAVFAGLVAVTRLAVSAMKYRHPGRVLTAGALAAATGTAGLAYTADMSTALLALGLAAAGTAVIFPTLMSVLAHHVDDTTRGTATATVTTLAYLGFLGGPVYVGRWAGAAGLPAAMLATAGLAAVLALLTWPALQTVTTRARTRPTERPDHAATRARNPH